MKMRSALAPFLLLASSLFALRSSLSAPPSAGPQIKAETAELQTAAGALVSFDDKAGLTISVEGKNRTIPADELLNIAVPGARAGGGAAQAAVFLRNGDLLCGSIVGGDENTLKINLAEGPELDVPLTEVGAIGLAADDRDAVWPAAAMAAPPADDTITLRNGDAFTGLLAGFTADSALLSAAAGKEARKFRVDRIRRIVPAKVGDPAKLKDGKRALRVRLTGGSVLTAMAWKIGSATADLSLLCGASVAGLPIGRIQRMTPVNGRLVRLSDLDPAEAVHTPFLGTAPVDKPKANRNAAGGPMVLNGKRYDFGWGVRSRTRLVFALDGKYKRFVSDYGIDDSVSEIVNPATGEPYADCVFRVFVDGQMKFEKVHVRWGRPYPRIELDVSGGKKLTLEVDYGDNDSIQDVADWADAALVK